MTKETNIYNSYPFQSLKLFAKTTAIAPVNHTFTPLATKDAVPEVESVLTLIEKSALDFTVKRRTSRIPNAGTGVFLYGTTQNGIYVDGKPKGLSKIIYKSLYKRENWPGAIQISDWTWMSDNDMELSNPLALGQYVNNGTTVHAANVCYQEIDLPVTFPHTLRRFIPNMYWNASLDPLSNQPMRLVALVALRDIQPGEELFSTYMDIV
ncbi:hypothetical protein [Parasitella parasitica]|uniref:SET domain-containing protein n=1 Tax=Parasitella parasitica TaxID=35722 RepID=A0A0B7NL92_9FUNG|nr:hypothetical protein [Parasitella parasitica]